MLSRLGGGGYFSQLKVLDGGSKTKFEQSSSQGWKTDEVRLVAERNFIIIKI